MMTAATRRPPAMMRGWMPLTLPETGACTAALTKPSGAPIFCPRYTRSPGLTSGLQGAPACCSSGTAASAGAGMASMGFAPVARFSSDALVRMHAAAKGQRLAQCTFPHFPRAKRAI